MTRLLSHPPVIPTSGPSDWMLDRLTEARGILADVPQHPVTLVILACRVVAGRREMHANAPTPSSSCAFWIDAPFPP